MRLAAVRTKYDVVLGLSFLLWVGNLVPNMNLLQEWNYTLAGRMARLDLRKTLVIQLILPHCKVIGMNSGAIGLRNDACINSRTTDII